MAFTRTAINTTGNTTAGSANITNVANTTGIFVGMVIYGANIPNDTLVSSISGTTVTINKNAIATQTGVAITGQYIIQSVTDTDPSGLSAMTGVTTIVEGSGTRLTAKYNLGLNQLRIQGTLTHNPDQYCIVANVQLSIIIEGTYNYGIEKVVNNRFSYSKGCGLDLTYGGGIASNFPIQMRSGQFNWRGGIIRFGGAFSMSGGTFNQKGDTSVAYNNNSGTQIQLRTILAPSAMNYDKIKLAGDNTTFFWTTQSYNSISANLENGAVQTAAGYIAAVQSYDNFIFANNQAPADFYLNQLAGGLSTLSVIKNPDIIPRVSQLNTGAYGVVEVRESLAFNVTDSNNESASNVTAYVKDSNNGSRTNENQLTYVNDFDYFASATGNVNLGDILINVQMRNPAQTNTVKNDYRGNFGTNSVDFNIYLGAYDYNQTVTRQSLLGNNGKNVDWTLFNDTNVSLSRTNAIAKLASSFTIDPVAKTITVTANSNYDDLYDIAKAYKYSGTKANVLVPTISDLIISANGSNLVAFNGWQLVVNSGVTLSSGTKFERITFATITNNGTITGVYSDSTGTSTVLTISGFDAGSSVYVEDNNEAQKFFDANASGEVVVYIPPTAVSPWYFAVEKYGNQRQSDFFNFSGGFRTIEVKAIPDVGITQTDLSVVEAYTQLDNLDKIYDYIAYKRLTPPIINYGQIAFRDGSILYLEDLSLLVNNGNSNVLDFDRANKLITIKTLILNAGTTYALLKADPPATVTANTTEQINVVIEDANGDSQVSILGGDNLGYELWKVTTATPTDDYEDGELLVTLPNNNDPYRFIGVSGFDIVGRDISSGVRRRTSMAKGIYTQAFYVGNEIQLATDAPQLIENNQKLDELILKVDTQKDPLTLPEFLALK